MNYRVIWLPEAERRLAEAWLNNPAARPALTRASTEMDRLLSLDPDNLGESRPKGRRILHVAPLAAIYRVHSASRTVRVITVWYFE